MKALLCCVLLAACADGQTALTTRAPAGLPLPEQAILYRDTVTVHFSDNSMCVAPRPGGARQWSGTLSGCPHLLPYRVDLPSGNASARRVLVRLEGGGNVVLDLGSVRFGIRPPLT